MDGQNGPAIGGGQGSTHSAKTCTGGWEARRQARHGVARGHTEGPRGGARGGPRIQSWLRAPAQFRKDKVKAYKQQWVVGISPEGLDGVLGASTDVQLPCAQRAEPQVQFQIRNQSGKFLRDLHCLELNGNAFAVPRATATVRLLFMHMAPMHMVHQSDNGTRAAALHGVYARGQELALE